MCFENNIFLIELNGISFGKIILILNKFIFLCMKLIIVCVKLFVQDDVGSGVVYVIGGIVVFMGVMMIGFRIG